MTLENSIMWVIPSSPNKMFQKERESFPNEVYYYYYLLIFCFMVSEMDVIHTLPVHE